MLTWRKIFSSKEDQKPGAYKAPNGKSIPNNVNFTGNKFPSSGNPVKKEQSAWQEGSKLQQQDSKKEISVKQNSPLMDDKTRRERFESLKSKSASRFFVKKSFDSSDWRTNLAKLADTSFKQKPDGTLQIDITTSRPGQDVQQNVQQPNQPIAPEQPVEQPETEKKASIKKAFYENNPEFKAWFSQVSEDQNFLDEYHQYIEQTQQSNEEVLTFEDWAVGQYESQQSKVASGEVKKWTIDQKGSYRLEGRECNTHCGVAIMKGAEEIEFQKVAKQGHEWRELIPQGIWQTKLETYASSK
jgi:hypothetical protein